MKATTKLWIALAALVVLTPLGLILPAKFGAGSAWGEWSGEEIKKLIGYVPKGMARLSGLWHAPLPDYGTPAQPGNPVGYVLSAVIGVAVVIGVSLLVGRLLARKRPHGS